MVLVAEEVDDGRGHVGRIISIGGDAAVASAVGDSPWASDPGSAVTLAPRDSPTRAFPDLHERASARPASPSRAAQAAPGSPSGARLVPVSRTWISADEVNRLRLEVADEKAGRQHLEEKLRQITEGLGALRSHAKEAGGGLVRVEQKLAQEVAELRQQVARGAEVETSDWRALRESFRQELGQWAARQQQLEAQFSDLNEDVARKMATPPVSPTVAPWDSGSDLEEQRFKAMEQRLRSEMADLMAERASEHSAQVSAVHGAISTHLADEKAARELHQSALNDGVENLLAQDRALSRHQAALGQDRFALLERRLDEVADKQAKEAARMMTKMSDELQSKLWEYHGSVRDPCAVLKERVDHLEGALGDLHGGPPSPARRRTAAAGGAPASFGERVERLETLVRDVAGPGAKKSLEDYCILKTESSELRERLKSLEEAVAGVCSQHAEEVKGAQSRVDQEGHVRSESNKAIVGRLEELQAALHAATSGHNTNLEQTYNALREEFHSGLEGEQAQRLGHEKALGETLAALEQRVESGLSGLGEKVGLEQAAWTKYYETVQGFLKEERKAREAHEKAAREQLAEESKALRDSVKDSFDSRSQDLALTDASLRQRVDFLETFLGESSSALGADAGSASLKLMRDPTHVSMKVRLDTLDRTVGKQNEAMERYGDRLLGEQEARATLHGTVMERLDYLEQMLQRSAQSQSQALEALIQGQLRRLSEASAKESSAAQSKLREELLESIGEERRSREKGHREIAEALESELVFGKRGHGGLSDQLQEQEKRLGQEVAALREEVAAQEKARVKHYEAVQGHLASEHRAREEAAKASRALTEGEREAREAHERKAEDHLLQERRAREAHNEQERAAREAHQERHRESARKEAEAREAYHKALEERLLEERALRDKQEAALRSFADRDAQERRRLLERLAREGADRDERLEALSVQLAGVQVKMEASVRASWSEVAWDGPGRDPAAEVRGRAGAAADRRQIAVAASSLAGRDASPGSPPSRWAARARTSTPEPKLKEEKQDLRSEAGSLSPERAVFHAEERLPAPPQRDAVEEDAGSGGVAVRWGAVNMPPSPEPRGGASPRSARERGAAQAQAWRFASQEPAGGADAPGGTGESFVSPSWEPAGAVRREPASFAVTWGQGGGRAAPPLPPPSGTLARAGGRGPSPGGGARSASPLPTLLREPAGNWQFGHQVPPSPDTIIRSVTEPLGSSSEKAKGKGYFSGPYWIPQTPPPDKAGDAAECQDLKRDYMAPSPGNGPPGRMQGDYLAT